LTVSFFDEFLAKVPTEDQAVLKKYPELQASVAKMESDLATTANFAGSWVNWQKENWDPQAGMTKVEKQLRADLDAAQARLAAGVGTVDDQQLDTKLQARLDDIKKSTAKDFQDKINGMNYFYEAVTKKAFAHQKEFGESLDPAKLREVIVNTGIQDPDVAYDKMVAEKRAEIAANAQKELETKTAADLAAAEQRGYAKAAQERAMGPNGVLPTDQTGGIAGITAHVGAPAKVSDEFKAKIASAKPGTGELAALGYEAYRRGDFGPVQ
jgi:hypothetical protein